MRQWIKIIEAEQSEFAEWFGNSRVVDAQGQPLVVFHGTNQPFELFSKERGGMATGPQAGAIHGFFFTSTETEAWDYAKHAGSKVVSNIDHFEQETERLRLEQERLEKIAGRTNKKDDWDAFYAAYQAWEDFEIDATREEEHVGNRVVKAYLSLQNPLEVNFNETMTSEAGVIEDVVAKALADGNDGVIMRNIYDGPFGGHTSDHFVAFSAEQIRQV
jgi:hypothetical protein